MAVSDLAVPVGPALLFPLGAAAGVVATLAMDVVAARLPEGTTPPTVAAGVLTGSHPDAAPPFLGRVVHYLAGGLTGPLLVWLLFATETVAGPSVVGPALAAAVLFVVMVVFFAAVVLPRADGVGSDRARRIGRDWALQAAAYVAVLVPLVVGAAAVV
jgi:hypothetical protein